MSYDYDIKHWRDTARPLRNVALTIAYCLAAILLWWVYTKALAAIGLRVPALVETQPDIEDLKDIAASVMWIGFWALYVVGAIWTYSKATILVLRYDNGEKIFPRFQEIMQTIRKDGTSE